MGIETSQKDWKSLGISVPERRRILHRTRISVLTELKNRHLEEFKKLFEERLDDVYYALRREHEKHKEHENKKGSVING